VEGIRIRRFRRIMKSRKINIQPLYGEYPSWVSYLSFDEEDCAYHSFYMILYWRWLREFFGEEVCM
jgi:hypothetical protein